MSLSHCCSAYCARGTLRSPLKSLPGPTSFSSWPMTSAGAISSATTRRAKSPRPTWTGWRARACASPMPTRRPRCARRRATRWPPAITPGAGASRRHVGLERGAAVPRRPEDDRPHPPGGRLSHRVVRQVALRRRVRDARRRRAGFHQADEGRARASGASITPTCCWAATRPRPSCSSRTTASPVTRSRSRS